MKKKVLLFLLALSVSALALGCGKEEEVVSEPEVNEEDVFVPDEPEEEIVEEPVVEEEVEVVPEGMYRSELTNEWIDESLKNQRPIAVMVDNEKIALPHYGLTKADIVYEMMNSTANDYVTRFMVLYKDYQSVDRIGSIRSVRPTNLQIAPEWDAIVCHDGGPGIYIQAHLALPYVNNFSGGFARIENGKPREFTEYIVTGDMDKKFNNSKVSREYTQYYQGQSWDFASEKKPVDLSTQTGSFACTFVDLPFKHNGSELKYDEATQTYLYSEYGQPHLDAGNNNQQLAFKNLIIQNATHRQFDSNGYMIFNIIDSDRDGYFITNGQAIPIKWTKETDTNPSRYYDLEGNEITFNTGKTYIAIVSDTQWPDLVLQ